MKKNVKSCLSVILSLVICSVFSWHSVSAHETDSQKHITEKYGEHFRINADRSLPPEKVFTGNVTYSDVSFENGKKLYGEPEQWTFSDFLKDGEALKYGTENIYLMSYPENHAFYFENINNEQEIPEEEQISAQEALRMAEAAVQTLNINAEVIGRYESDVDPAGLHTYILGGVINGLPVAGLSDIYSNGSVEIAGNQYSYVSYIRNYVPEEQKEAELLDFSEILERVRTYINAGYITLPNDNSCISDISLSYYVEKTSDGMIFYPVWNFQIPPIAQSALMLGRDTDDLFYINAIDGMLVKTMY